MFVSHSPELVRQICDRAVVLDHGEMIGIGPPGESIRTFRESLMRGTKARQLHSDDAVDDQGDQRIAEAPALDPDVAPPPAIDLANFDVRITRVRMDYPLADERDFLVPGDPLRIKVGYHAVRRIDDVVFSLNIINGDGLLVYGVNTDHLLGGLAYVQGDGTLEFAFERVPLLDGIYTVSIGIHSHDVSIIYDHHSAGHTFQVTNPGIAAGMVALDASVTLDHAADKDTQVAG